MGIVRRAHYSSPEREGKELDDAGTAKHSYQRRSPEILSRRHPRKSSMDSLKLGFDDCEIGAGLIDLA
jgi:hypothetical protein